MATNLSSKTWMPPAQIPREKVIAMSETVLGKPSRPVKVTEDIFRVEALGQEGPQALMRLPWLMEEIFDAWEV